MVIDAGVSSEAEIVRCWPGEPQRNRPYQMGVDLVHRHVRWFSAGVELAVTVLN
jgi:hypothetical protein